MKRRIYGDWILTMGLIIILFPLNLRGISAKEDNRICVDCHEKRSSSLVLSWRESRMAQSGVTCIDCHGSHGRSPLWRMSS
jgi:hypothetical protein